MAHLATIQADKHEKSIPQNYISIAINAKMTLHLIQRLPYKKLNSFTVCASWIREGNQLVPIEPDTNSYDLTDEFDVLKLLSLESDFYHLELDDNAVTIPCKNSWDLYHYGYNGCSSEKMFVIHQWKAVYGNPKYNYADFIKEAPALVDYGTSGSYYMVKSDDKYENLADLAYTLGTTNRNVVDFIL
jgi:hypothetical protein